MLPRTESDVAAGPYSNMALLAAMLWAMTPSSDLQRRAEAIAQKTEAAIEKAFWDPKLKSYKEKEGEPNAVFNWGAGVMLSALNARKNEKRIEEWWPVLDSYWNPRPPVPGYDVVPKPGGIDRYYDDNAWMAIALFEAGKTERAKGALAYALSGWDEKLGGGIYWRESDKASKNACANAPVSAAASIASKMLGDDAYRVHAEKILEWILKNLQDPKDLLIWDNISLAGKVEKTKWSYNTALTIRALAYSERRGVLRPVTSQAMWKAAWKHWAKSDGIKCEGKFAHLLVETGLELNLLSSADKEYVVSLLERLGEEGQWRYGHRWHKPLNPGQRGALIDSASVLRVAGLLAQKS